MSAPTDLKKRPICFLRIDGISQTEDSHSAFPLPGDGGNQVLWHQTEISLPTWPHSRIHFYSGSI